MTAAPTKVAVLVDRLGEGGAQRSAILVATQLHELGFGTHVLCARSGTYASELPQELPVHVLAPRWPSASGVVRFVINLCVASRRHDIQVIVVGGFTVARLALLLRAISPIGLPSRVRVVVVEHNTASSTLRDRFPHPVSRRVILRLTRWLYQHADALVAVSDGASRDLERTLALPPGSVTTIFNPVDTGRIRRSITDTISMDLEQTFQSLPRPMVITTGRLVAQKAHDDLIMAFSRLPGPLLGSLVVLGEGPLRSELEECAERMGIRGRVWMPGFVDNPWWFIARADVFALSSRWEGFGMVLAEALACGVSVVSTDCPSGPREILESVPVARLVPMNDPTALTAALTESLGSKHQGTVATGLERFQPPVVARQYAALISSVLEQEP